MQIPARRLVALSVALLALCIPQIALAQVANVYATRVAPSLVFIKAKLGKGEHVGTGFVIASDDRSAKILTASHVVFHSKTAQAAVYLPDNPGTPVAATILFVGNDQQDVALLEVAKPNLPFVDFSATPAKVLDTIAVAGFGESSVLYSDLQPRVVPGTVSALPAHGVRIEHTAETTAGFSGGPVFLTDSGKVVGITQGVLRDSAGNTISGANTALSLDVIRPLLEQWQVPVAAFRTPEPKRGRGKPVAQVTPAPTPSPAPTAPPSATPTPKASASPSPSAAAPLAMSVPAQSLRKVRFKVQAGGANSFVNASVISVGLDHGLTVDVSEDMGRRRGAAVRLDVGAGGRLTFVSSPSRLSAEQEIVLRMLAPDIIPQNQIPHARMTWGAADNAAGMRSDLHYKIITMGDGRHVQISLNGNLGSIGASGPISGRASYDLKLLVPQNISLSTAHGRVDISLIEDSARTRR